MLTQFQGIGVRTSVYVQALLPVLSALPPLIAHGSVLDESKVVVDSVRSGTVALLTGVALIISAIIQAKTYGLSILHALLVLNLCWVTAFASLTPLLFAMLRIAKNTTKRGIRGTTRKTLVMSYVFCVKLMLMGCYGIWVLHQPMAFDTSPESCTASTVFYLLGHHPLVVSPNFRVPSLVLYSLMLVPGINLIVICIATIPFQIAMALIVFTVSLVWDGKPNTNTSAGATPTERQQGKDGMKSSEGGEDNQYQEVQSMRDQLTVILIPLFVNALIIMTTEMTMRSNTIGGEDRRWSLGQTSAMLVALIPAFSVAHRWRKWFRDRRTKGTGEVEDAPPSADAKNEDDDRKDDHNSGVSWRPVDLPSNA